MNHLLSGFTDELLKLGAFAQQDQDPSAYDSASSVSDVMNKALGRQAKSGLTSGMPVHTASGTKKPVPGPRTTPNYMAPGYASKS